MSFEETQKEIKRLQKEDEELIPQIAKALEGVTNSLIKDFSKEKHDEAMKEYQELHDKHIKIQNEILSMLTLPA